MLRKRNGAFTLIEWLVVLAILGLLFSLLVFIVLTAHKEARKAATMSLICNIGEQVDAYMLEFRKLGNLPDSRDFADAPWIFLHRNLRAVGKEPYLQPPSTGLSKGAGPFVRADPNDGEHILDGFPTSDFSNRLRFEIVNRTNASGAVYVLSVRIVSQAGTPNDPRDDIIYAYTSDSGEFGWVKP